MEKKLSKSERLSIMTHYFVQNPSKVFTLQFFSELLDSAKSTLSEDIDILRHLFEKQSLGIIKSISGAAGGLYYSPIYNAEQMEAAALDLCTLLRDESRIIIGGFLYTTDILYTPSILETIARSITTKFVDTEIDYIVTVETKGIPLAMMIGRLLHKPVVTIRKSARLTEGTTIQMNYMASSNGAIKTMALPIKSIHRESKVLFVDDFMKAGGTAKGVIDLLRELNIEVMGKAFVMATKEPAVKLIDDYYAMVELDHIDEEKNKIFIYPNKN
ncbi:MAG: pur operon repressor [Vallitaleaceae bacterium]|jgi:purine operon repressor|nr:pur operon repressor [Vallitaleaceae bacterium]